MAKGLDRRGFLQGAGALALLPGLPAWSQTPEGGIRYGWAPDIVTAGAPAVVVSPEGDDGAAGTLAAPLRTVSAGVARLAAAGSGILALRGGVYRESVSLDALKGTAAAPFRIQRHGGERAVISAADVVTGWQPCTPADEAALGIRLDGVWVLRLPRADLRHGQPLALNLHEAGEWSSIATDRADPSGLDHAGNYRKFHVATAELGPGDKVLGFTDARLTRRSPAQMEQVRVLFHHAPNLVSSSAIAQFEPATGKVALARRELKVQRDKAGPAFRYALLNAPTALIQGTWVVREEPGAKVAVFYFPRDPANLDGRIEMSLRDHCLDLGSARHVEIQGLEFLRAAGEDRTAGMGIRLEAKKGETGDRGLKITHCRAGETMSTASRGYGAVYIRGVEGLTISNLTIDRARGSFGIFLNDCTGADLRFLHLTGISQSPARFFGLRNAILAFSLMEESGWDAHANQFNFYEGSDAILVYGIRTRNLGGYATYQEASRIFYAFCDLAPSGHEGDSRVLASQNRSAGSGQGGPDGSGAPVENGIFWYWNLTLPAKPSEPVPAKALTLGPGGSTQNHAVHNCILHGGGFADLYLKKSKRGGESRSHNIYTGLAHWQSRKYGWSLAAGESLAKPGSVPRGRGLDMREVIAAQIAPLFPAFTDWDRDVDFRPVDWSAPPIGASVG